MNVVELRRCNVLLVLAVLVLLTACSKNLERPSADDLTQAQLKESCDFTTLDGANGVRAKDIPVAKTPGCGYTTFPSPILTQCSEALAPGIPDLRGIWVDQTTTRGHVERVEQCGNRIAITAGGVVHDMFADGTYEHGVNDVAARDCSAISVKAEFIDGVHTLSPKGLPLTVTRRLEGDRLIWNYPTGVYELTALCRPGDAQGLSELAN